MAKADNVSKFRVCVGYHRAFYHGTLIVEERCDRICRHSCEACNRVTDGRIIPRILIATIQKHFRLHTNFYRDICRQAGICIPGPHA